MRKNRRIRASIRRSLQLVIALIVLVLMTIQPAHAADGGYPHATMPCIHSPYKTQGSGYWCKDYTWGPDKNNYLTIYSTRGYAYRNCTDYVAWKLQSMGVADKWTRGLGHGGAWYASASNKTGLKRGNTPQVGAAAIVPISKNDNYGHVAYVEQVNKDSDGKVTTITVSEYNYGQGGNYGTRTGKPAALGFTLFVYFGEHMTNPPSESGSNPDAQPNQNPLIHSVKRTTSPNGVRQVYAATKTAVTEAWWMPGGDGVHTHEIIHIRDADIVGFDKTNLPDGTQAVYTAVPDGIWETWFRPDGSGSSKIVSGLSGVRQVIADNHWEGSQFVHRLYVLAQDGPYEVWWRDGGDGVHVSRLTQLAGGVTFTKSAGPDDAEQLYIATPTWVYEVWWFPGGAIHVTPVLNIAQGDIRSLSKGDILPDGGQLLYTGTSTTAWQSYWKPGVSMSHGTIATSQTGVVQIKKTITNGTHQLYLATPDHVQEYWWHSSGSGGGELIRIAQGTIAAFDKVSDDAQQQLYTAAGRWVYETWWAGGVSPTTTGLFQVAR